MRSLPPVRHVRDLLALVQFDLGFPPRRSIVLVPTGGGARSGGPMIRFDLDLMVAARDGDARHRSLAREVFGDVIDHVRRDGAGAAVVLVIADGEPGRGDGDRDDEDGDDDARASDVDLAAWVGRRVEDAGVACLPLLLVRGGRWCALDPRGGDDVEQVVWDEVGDVLLSPVAAAMIREGNALVADRAQLLPPLPDAHPQAAGAACRCPSVRTGSAWLTRWLRALDALEQDASADVDERALACLVAAMGTDLALRDAVLVSFVCAQPAVPRAVVSAGAIGIPGGGRDWHEAFDRGMRRPVDHARVAAGEALLERLLQVRPWHGPEEGLAVLAWVSWWAGRGARAQVLADEVLRRRPGHRLARLTTGMIEGLVPPPWVDAA